MMSDKVNVKIHTSPILKNVDITGEIVITLENCEPLPIHNISIIVEALPDILEITPKKKLISTIQAGQTSKAHFSAIPKASNMGFAVTTRYKYKNNLHIHTSDHIIQI